MHDSISLVRKL